VTSWFDEARLGMFVHWDHASQQGARDFLAARRWQLRVALLSVRPGRALPHDPRRSRPSHPIGSGARCRSRALVFDPHRHHRGLAPDPDGEVTVEIPESAIDPDATVIALDIAPEAEA
jgi:hypothetical protein